MDNKPTEPPKAASPERSVAAPPDLEAQPATGADETAQSPTK